jgi:hypothetical protein
MIDTLHSPGDATAYVAGQRHMLDDDTPIAYRTHTGGPRADEDHERLRAERLLWSIRRDPVRANPLYASTEHGVYVSSSDGNSRPRCR